MHSESQKIKSSWGTPPYKCEISCSPAEQISCFVEDLFNKTLSCSFQISSHSFFSAGPSPILNSLDVVSHPVRECITGWMFDMRYPSVC